LKEVRRFRALEHKNDCCTLNEIVDALRVAKAAVSKWMKAAREGGEAVIQARPRKGATPAFSKELEMLQASSILKDAAYNLTREVKTLRI
jgi:transposase